MSPPPVPFDLVASRLLERPARTIDTGGEQWRRAAVAAIFRPSERGTDLLLLRRASHAADPWSGQISFPGGREEPEDEDLVHTARRETEEEVGLGVLDGGRLLGPLDALQARAKARIHKMSIHPQAFLLESRVDRDLVLNPAEVARAFWVPLSTLADPGNRRWYDAQRVGVPFRFPAIDVDGTSVPLWGLTHRMVLEILARLDLVHHVDALSMPLPPKE